MKKTFCFLSLIVTFDFIVTMVVFYRIIAITLPATTLLQSETIDILQVMNLITALKGLCFNMRHNIDDYYEKWQKEAILIAGKQNVLEHGLLYLHGLTLCILKKKLEGQIFKRSFA